MSHKAFSARTLAAAAFDFYESMMDGNLRFSAKKWTAEIGVWLLNVIPSKFLGIHLGR